jgi:hypothetical protein
LCHTVFCGTGVSLSCSSCCFYRNLNMMYSYVKTLVLFSAWPLAWTDSSEWRTIIWDVGRLYLKVLRCTLPVQGVGLQPLACWDSGFESHRRHGRLSLVSVVCCEVEFSATSWSFVQRSPTDCGVSCVICNPREWGGPGPLGAFAPKTNKQRWTLELWLYSHWAHDACFVQILEGHLSYFCGACVCVCGLSEVRFKVKEVFVCCSVASVVRDTHGLV